MKGYLKRYLIPLLLFVRLTHADTATARDSLSENNQSVRAGISYSSFRKSFFHVPVEWKNRLMTAHLSYEFTYAKFCHSVEISYGRGGNFKINGKTREGNNTLCLWDISYDLTWQKLRAEGPQRFFWGLGVSIQNSEVRQRIDVAPGKFNEHKDEYFGLGPLFTAFYKFSDGKLLTKVHLCVTTAVPGASRSTIKTEGVYSDDSYLLWFRIKSLLRVVYRLSGIYKLECEFKRQTYVYARSQRPEYKFHHLFSGGTYLLNSFGLGLQASF